MNPGAGTESVRPKVHHQVKVGIGVLVCRGDKVLIGKRKGSNGSGKYALPGGHLEMGEAFEECAAREVEEETGLHLMNARYVATFNSIFSVTCHYVTVFVRGEVPLDAVAVNLEPTKCEGWRWVRWDDIPEPVFEPLRQLLVSGFNPFHEAPQASCFPSLRAAASSYRSVAYSLAGLLSVALLGALRMITKGRFVGGKAWKQLR